MLITVLNSAQDNKFRTLQSLLHCIEKDLQLQEFLSLGRFFEIYSHRRVLRSKWGGKNTKMKSCIAHNAGAASERFFEIQ